MLAPSNTDLVNITPKKEKEYQAYCLWRSVPFFFRNPPRDKATGVAPVPRDFAMSMGIEDEIMLDLCGIKTQKEFGAIYDVHPDTLSDWNKTYNAQNGLEEAKKWAQSLTKNVLFSLYNNALRKGGYYEVKLWLQVVENWQEKQQVDHTYLGVATVNYEIVPNKPSPVLENNG